MPLLKRIDETKNAGVQLVRPEFVAVMFDERQDKPDTSELEKLLSDVLARTGGNAIVGIIPISENMPSQTITRKKKNSTEEVASAIRYSSSKAAILPFGFSENNLRARFILDEKLDAEDEDDDAAA